MRISDDKDCRKDRFVLELCIVNDLILIAEDFLLF
jgi:hypothetical protein